MEDFDKYKTQLTFPKDREGRNAYYADIARLAALFRADALEAVGLTGHPKADKAYSLAYERGHSSGYSEIYNELVDLAELLLD